MYQMSKVKESLLWKFYRKNESRTHFILGTMHVASADAYVAVARAKHYMEQCLIYAGEMDLNDPELDNIGTYFLNSDGITLENLIGVKKYNKYKVIIKKAYKVDLDSITHFKPLVISNMIAESVITKTYDLALDHFLWEYGEASDMQMEGLESATKQFQIMKEIPMESQLKSLKACIKNVNSFKKKILKLSEYYTKGEMTKLYKMSKKSMGELRKLMIYDRNIYMTNKLVVLCNQGAVFAAVGAAHLGGAKGILKLLKEADYIVKPIKI